MLPYEATVYHGENRTIYSKESEKLKERGIYLWVSDYRQVDSSTYRRLVLIAEFWLLSDMKDKSEDDIAWAINEECAEGCRFNFLSGETFLVGDTTYKVGVFEKGYA